VVRRGYAYFTQIVQQWAELELVDLPTCERCGFQGRRPESVSEKLSFPLLRAELRVCIFFPERHTRIRRSLLVGRISFHELVRCHIFGAAKQ
jgi:hypothetical protein